MGPMLPLCLPPMHGGGRANGQPSTAAGVAPGQDWSRGHGDWTVAQAGNFTDKFSLTISKGTAQPKK